MRSLSRLPYPLPLGPFSYGDAMSAHVPRSRLRAGDLFRPHRGIYAQAGESLDLAGRCELLLHLLGEHRWFSHLTAARLWGMPLPFGWSDAEGLHVLTLAGAPPMRRAGVIGWETGDVDTDRALIGLLPVIGPAEVWCQLAVPGATGIEVSTGEKRSLHHGALVAAGDFLLTGPRPFGRGQPRVALCTIDALARAVEDRRGRRGVTRLVDALGDVRAGAHSPQETKLRLGLVGCGLPEPSVQVPVQTAAGLRHSDLGYPTERVLLEYQGDHHRTDRQQWLEDLTRVQLFEDAGYRVILIGAHDLEPDCSALAQRVRRALTR